MGANPTLSPRSETCRDARRAVAFYRAAERKWRFKMGAGPNSKIRGTTESSSTTCPHLRLLAKHARQAAHGARVRYERWSYQWEWRRWLPQPYRAIFQCETPIGRDGINWQHNSGTYQGGPGFYYGTWDGYKPRGYPAEAYQASPRQQFIVAQRVARAVGFGAWGCYSHGGYRYHLP